MTVRPGRFSSHCRIPLLEEYAPPSVVVDARGEIRYYWGTKLSVFLPPRAGAPATNLMHLARRELRVELSAALHNAARLGKPVTYKDVVVEAEGVQRRLRTARRSPRAASPRRRRRAGRSPSPPA